MPPGFYAMTMPPEEIAKPIDRETEEKKDVADDDQQKSDEDGKKDGAEDGAKDADAPKPTGPVKFGTLGGRAPAAPHADL
ncbi:MAG: hypothetical protein IPF82_06735 [Blastocatellia bacterium]|nr:hypothetical protein [Blastocatellia bacterium]